MSRTVSLLLLALLPALALAQMDLLRRGDSRLVDPETGEEYVLVPVAEYKRLSGR